MRTRGLSPWGGFIRAKLRRRIFVWFLGSILATGLAVFLAVRVFSHLNDSDWSLNWTRSQEWVGQQFARDWNDSERRAHFAHETAAALHADVELLDANASVLMSTGVSCRRPAIRAPVRVGGAVVGEARICLPHQGEAPWRAALTVVLGLLVVWKVSGSVAKRLASPLDDLAEVVRRLGGGDLSARATTSCHQPDEIGLVAEAVNDMATRIEKQMVDQRELLATVSHELRTPLARVRIISEIARDTGATALTFDALDLEVEEMDALVGQLLASSRLEFGQVTKREVSIRDHAARAVERAGLVATALSVTGEGDRMVADPTLLQRALANLFDNAKKHGLGADALEVTVTGESVRFEVLDRGPGIIGDGVALFEKFNRGPNKPGVDGLGLGLALVKRIALAHGGTVWALAREGGGARVGFGVSSAVN